MNLTKTQNIIRDLVAAYDTGLLTKEHAMYEATCVYSEMLKVGQTGITQAAYIALLEAIITHYVEGQILTYKIKSY